MQFRSNRRNVISIAIAISVAFLAALIYSQYEEKETTDSTTAAFAEHGSSTGIIPIVRAEPAPAPAPLPPPPTTFQYEVKWGDTLSRIARNTCNEADEISRDNHILNQNLIYESQVLVLKKVEQCSPRKMVKAKPFPENVSHVHGGASPKKTFSDPGETTTATHETASYVNCGLIIRRIKERLDKILMGTKCIEDNYGDIIREAIAEIDPRIEYRDVVAMIYIESNGYVGAVNSATDCHGLMQLQTPTARSFGVKHIYNARENIFGGVRVLSSYTYDYFGGSRAHGLAAYNMGNGKLREIIARWPHYNPSTRNPYFLEVERIRAIIENQGA